MTGKTHMIIGIAASLYILPKLGYNPGIAALSAAALGGLIPDMDHPKSKINQRILPIKNKLGKMLIYSGIGSLLIYYNDFKSNHITLAGIILIMIGMSHHRGFTHSIVGVSIISVITFHMLNPIVPISIIISFCVGVTSHVLADYMTKEGVELFYPLTKRNYRFLLHTSTDSIVEKGILFFLIVFISKTILKM